MLIIPKRASAEWYITMANIVKGSGEYKAKTGLLVAYSFEYNEFESLQDAIGILGDVRALKQIQRMEKLDANNTARESAKSANGDSTRKVQTESEKAEAKALRQQKDAFFKACIAKGITSLDDLNAVL
jgi:hypothetical protein